LARITQNCSDYCTKLINEALAVNNRSYGRSIMDISHIKAVERLFNTTNMESTVTKINNEVVTNLLNTDPCAQVFEPIYRDFFKKYQKP